MVKSIGGDDEDVDPNGPTTRSVFGRGAKADTDGDRPTLRRKSYDVDDDTDADERTVRFSRRSGETGAAGEEPEVLTLPAGWLVVVKGPGLGHVATIQAGMNILGRGEGSQIVLDFGDRAIAREDHVRFIYNRLSRRFHVAPGRGPETWLKGELVMQAEPIVRGDLITVGTTMLRFVPFCDEGFDWDEDNSK